MPRIRRTTSAPTYGLWATGERKTASGWSNSSRHEGPWPPRRRARCRGPGASSGPSQRRRHFGALLDGAFGVEFRGDIGTADQADIDARLRERIVQLALRFLTGAEHDGVALDDRALAADGQVQAEVVDPP